MSLQGAAVVAVLLFAQPLVLTQARAGLGRDSHLDLLAQLAQRQVAIEAVLALARPLDQHQLLPQLIAQLHAALGLVYFLAAGTGAFYSLFIDGS